MSYSSTLWTMESGATNDIDKDRGSFIDYRQLPFRRIWLYVVNNESIEVQGIETCKLKLHGEWVLLLHDVLYIQDIWWNLIWIISLLILNFSVNFYNNFIDILYDTGYYGSSYLFDGFIVYDIICWFNYISNNHDCFDLITSIYI